MTAEAFSFSTSPSSDILASSQLNKIAMDVLQLSLINLQTQLTTEETKEKIAGSSSNFTVMNLWKRVLGSGIRVAAGYCGTWFSCRYIARTPKSRADLIAAFGGTTGKLAFEGVLEGMKSSPEGRWFLDTILEL